MGAIVRFGVTNLLPNNFTHRERQKFLTDFAELELSRYFIEELTNHFDPGSEQLVFGITCNGGKTEMARIMQPDYLAFNATWQKLLPIIYDHWHILQHVDVLLPNYAEEGLTTTYIPELKRRITICSIEQGMEYLKDAGETDDAQTSLFREIMLELFQIALDNQFAVIIG